MRFGHFDDAAREYVITRPDTPYPWINYLGSEDFFGLFSNTSGGYCFYKDARMLRLTRYRYNNVPTDAGGRYFYVKDGDSVWTPGWLPVKAKLDSYECRHGMGYSVISSKKDNLSVKQKVRGSSPFGRAKKKPLLLIWQKRFFLAFSGLNALNIIEKHR